MCNGIYSARYPLPCDVARLCPGECQKTTDINIYRQDVKYISTKRKYCDACKVHHSTITQHSHVHTHIHGPHTYNQIHDREGAVPPSNSKTPALNTLQQHPPGVPRHLCPGRAAAHNGERATARAPARQRNTCTIRGLNPKRPAHNSRPDPDTNPNCNRAARPEHTAHIPAAPARHATPPRRAPLLPPTPAARLHSAALAGETPLLPVAVTRTSRLSLFPARLLFPPARHRVSRPTQQLVQQNRLRARLAPKLRNSAGRTAPLLLQGRTKGSGTTRRVEAALPLVGEFRS